MRKCWRATGDSFSISPSAQREHILVVLKSLAIGQRHQGALDVMLVSLQHRWGEASIGRVRRSVCFRFFPGGKACLRRGRYSCAGVALERHASDPNVLVLCSCLFRRWYALAHETFGS